jgi:hypothetical protein
MLVKDGLERDLQTLAEEYSTLEELDEAIAWYQRDRFGGATLERRADARGLVWALRRVRRHHDDRVTFGASVLNSS